MSVTADRLATVLHDMQPRLAEVTESEASAKPANGHWSKKEILGHLIDSAANNHQRFVRAQLAPHLDIASYQQEQWVATQRYDTEPWVFLVNLWLLLNRHLVHIIRSMPSACLAHTVSLGGKEPITLGFVLDDYLKHLQHHLSQILPPA